MTQEGERPGRRRVVRVADLLRLHPRVPVDTARHGDSAVPVDSILRREGRTGPLGVVLPDAAGTAHAVPRHRTARVTGTLLVAGSAFGAAAVITAVVPPPGELAPVAASRVGAALALDEGDRDRDRVPLGSLVPVTAPADVPAPAPAPEADWTQVAFPGADEQDAQPARPARSGGDGSGRAPAGGPTRPVADLVEDVAGDPTRPVADLVEDGTDGTTVVRVERSSGGGSSTHSSSSSTSVSGGGSASVVDVRSSTSGGSEGVYDLDGVFGRAGG